MEFPTLGKNCMKEDCNDLDFLPIKCHFCGDFFCAKHFLPEDHQCQKYESKCASITDKTIQKYLCCVPGCKRSELAPVTCLHCSIVICLQHRHQQDHDCPKLVLPQKSMTATKAVVDEILSSAPAPPKTEKKVRSVKAQKTAAKVQLMKLKMKSIGDKSLPQEERIYFLVTPPKSTGKSPTGVWVSSRWVMGKVVDSVAASLSVQNHNNVGGRTKLKLLRGADGESVCEDMSAPLAALLDSEQLFNGDKVSLEYVENSS